MLKDEHPMSNTTGNCPKPTSKSASLTANSAIA